MNEFTSKNTPQNWPQKRGPKTHFSGQKTPFLGSPRPPPYFYPQSHTISLANGPQKPTFSGRFGPIFLGDPPKTAKKRTFWPQKRPFSQALGGFLISGRFFGFREGGSRGSFSQAFLWFFISGVFWTPPKKRHFLRVILQGRFYGKTPPNIRAVFSGGPKTVSLDSCTQNLNIRALKKGSFLTSRYRQNWPQSHTISLANRIGKKWVRANSSFPKLINFDGWTFFTPRLYLHFFRVGHENHQNGVKIIRLGVSGFSVPPPPTTM